MFAELAMTRGQIHHHLRLRKSSIKCCSPKICTDDERAGRGIHHIPEDKKVFSFRNINNFRIFYEKFKAYEAVGTQLT